MRLISLWTRAMEAAKRAVNPPIMAITIIVWGEVLKMKNARAMR